MSSKLNYSEINTDIKTLHIQNISTTPLKNQIKISRQPKSRRETSFQSKKSRNFPEQSKKIDIKKLPPKLSIEYNKGSYVDSLKRKKNIILTEEERNALKKEIKEEIQDSILKQIKDSEINIISSLNNGFSFLGSIFNRSYDEFLKNKAKVNNEADSINTFDMCYKNKNIEKF